MKKHTMIADSFLKKKIKNVGRSLQNTHSVMVAEERRVEKW